MSTAPLKDDTRLRVKQLFGFLAILTALLLLFHGPLVLGTAVFAGGDLVNHLYPLRFVQERHGWFAPWNDATYAGRPLADDIQVGVFYPPNWLHLTGLPAERIVTLLCLLHLAVGALGFFLLARRWSGFAGATIASIAWSFGAYQSMRLTSGVIVFTMALAWLPWMMAASLEAGLGRGHPRRAAGLLALFGALQLLAGAAQLVHMTWVGLGFLVVGRIAAEPNHRERLSILGGHAAALMLVLMLCAPQLAGVLRLQADAAPRHGADPWVFLSDGSLEWRTLLTWILPEFFAPGNHEAIYWGGTVGYTETGNHPGIVVLALALAGLVYTLAGWRTMPRAERTWWVAVLALALFGFLVALGANGFLFRPLTQWVPGFGLFRVPVRWGLWVAVAVALLAARGIDLLTAGNDAGSRPLVAWAAGVGTLLLGLLALRAALPLLLDSMGLPARVAAMQRVAPDLAELVAAHPARSLGWAIGMVVATAAIGAGAVLGRLGARPATVLLVLIATIDLYRFWLPYIQTIPADATPPEIESESEYHRIPAAAFRGYFYPDSPLVRDLRALPGRGRLHYNDTIPSYQFDQFHRELLLERPAAAGLEVARGYQQLLLASYVADYYASQSVSAANRFDALLSMMEMADRRFLDAYNITHLLSIPFGAVTDGYTALGLEPMGALTPWGVAAWRNPGARGWVWLSDEEKFLDAAPAPLGTVTLDERTPARWAGRAEVTGPAWLHLSVPHYRGYTLVATNAAGRRVEGANSRSIRLPEAGTWAYERVYRSAGLAPLPLGLALLGLLGAAVLLWPRRADASAAEGTEARA